MIVTRFSFLKAHCYALPEDDVYCGVTQFWKKGFVALQAAINAAIIEVSTKCPVQVDVQCRLMILEASKFHQRKYKSITFFFHLLTGFFTTMFI